MQTAQPFSIEYAHQLTGIIVDVVVIIGAIAAVMKFRLFNILGHRWRSDLACSHYVLPDSSVIFTVDYTINNTGQRPLRLSDVTIRVTGVRNENSLLVPDDERVLAMRRLRPEDPTLKGLFQIEPGERTIFTLRAQLPDLDDAVFILCEFGLPQKRVPGGYRGFYVKSSSETNTSGRNLKSSSVDV